MARKKHGNQHSSNCKRLLWLIHGLFHPSVVFVAQGFSNSHPPSSFHSKAPRNQLLRHQATIDRSVEDPQQQSSSSSLSSSEDFVIVKDFWGSTIRHHDDVEESNDLPCISNLDPSGPLPRGAYYHEPQSSNTDASSSFPPPCRVSVALDVQNADSANDDNPFESMIDQVHAMMDDGFSSFQVLYSNEQDTSAAAQQEAHFYRTLLQNTPGSILRRHAQMTIPWTIPHDTTSSAAVHPRAIRASIKQSLGRLLGEKEDILPTIQLIRPTISTYQRPPVSQQQSSSSSSFIRREKQTKELPLHLDVLDALEDLRRDGFIADVAAREWTSSMLRSSHACGYALSQHQVDMNLLTMESSYNFDSLFASRDLEIPLQATSPLLGGLLSDKFVNRPLVPLSRELSASAYEYLTSNLVDWQQTRHPQNHRRSDDDEIDLEHAETIRAWHSFSNQLLPTLEHMARKKCVPSLSTVAMRWLLQLDQVESVVVRTQASHTDDFLNNHHCRWRDWRNVFRMDLDEEEMEELWEWTTYQGIPDFVNGDPFSFSNTEEDDDFLDLEQSSGGLFLPGNSGSSSKKLWL